MMNVRWVVLLALVVLVEKITPFGRQIALLAGVVIVAGHAWLNTVMPRGRAAL
jgi:predicted metal-binding membrane protein